MGFFKRKFGVTLVRNREGFAIVQRRRLFRTNEIGARIFELCDGKTSIAEMSNKLLKIYDVSNEELLQDVQGYINTMLELNIVEEVQL